MKTKRLLGVALLLITISACGPGNSGLLTSTPTSIAAVSTQTVSVEASSIRLYNLVADIAYLALDLGSDHIEFGGVAQWTVTEYYAIQDLADPIYVLISDFDAIEVLGPFDIIDEITPGENTFVLQYESGQIALLPFDNDIDLRTEPKLDEIWLRVGPHKVPCEKMEGEGMCFLVKYTPEHEWEILVHEIGGFRYEPGHEYELFVFKFENHATALVRYEMHQLVDKNVSTE